MYLLIRILAVYAYVIVVSWCCELQYNHMKMYYASISHNTCTFHPRILMNVQYMDIILSYLNSGPVSVLVG